MIVSAYINLGWRRNQYNYVQQTELFFFDGRPEKGVENGTRDKIQYKRQNLWDDEVIKIHRSKDGTLFIIYDKSCKIT